MSDLPPSPPPPADRPRQRTGGHRHHTRPRCPSCGLHLNLCPCATLPQIATRHRVLVVQHALEGKKPTNTVRLLLRLLPAARRLVFGLRDQPFDPEALRGLAPGSFVLFPRPDALLLEAPPAVTGEHGEPPTLVLVDGTWSHASRMARRVPGIADLPCHRLPDGVTSAWKVRLHPDPSRISTFEAATHALRILEGATVADPLEAAFTLVVSRLWAMKRGEV